VLPPQEERVRRATPRLKGRVLVADDGIDNQRLIERILQVAGLQVEVVDNGAAAVERVLQAASQQPFDAVLMDMQMPVMDGLEATRTLRDQGYAGPIIALTANVLPEDRERCAEAGCTGFAGKPIDRAHLYDALGAALTKH
jgi:CheY-like chemotaxis protein